METDIRRIKMKVWSQFLPFIDLFSWEFVLLFIWFTLKTISTIALYKRSNLNSFHCSLKERERIARWSNVYLSFSNCVLSKIDNSFQIYFWWTFGKNGINKLVVLW
jgi:hypothetical protein